MELRVIKDIVELEKLKNDWNTLLLKSASHVPFLRHEYLSSWWKTLGGGEWDFGYLHVITGTRQGELAGIAPFFSSINLDGRPALLFLGSIEISDFLDVIAPSESLPVFIESLMAYLDGLDSPNWEVIDLYNILEDSASIPLITDAASRYGWKTVKERLQPAPSIALPNSWEDYMGLIKKKQRHEIRRKIRRAENYILPINWYIVDDESTLDDEIQAFLQLMAFDPQKDTFLTEIMQTQMRESVHTAFKGGWLQLSFLEFGGEKAAAYLNFDYANNIWVYNSGINFNFSELSPGWVLLAYLIQWAIDNERECFDFMRGDEAYKYRFGGVNRYVYRLQVIR
jgi:CelD/BcsL family acetyltransferase involved in cellulose biosynthesis